MAKIRITVAIALIVLSPIAGLSQTAFAPPLVPSQPPPAPAWNNAGILTFPAFPGSGWSWNRPRFQDELWRIIVDARIGRQWMNWNTFFPFSSNSNPELQSFEFERMDVTLKDGDFWVGFADLELQPIRNLAIFSRYGANIPRLSAVEMDASGRATRPLPGNGANSTSPWYWDTWFHWWMWEGGLAWWFTPAVAFELGFRTEHIDYKLENPRNLTEPLARIPPGRAIT